MTTKILKGAFAITLIFTTLAFTIMNKDINIKDSTVVWKGKKITGSHTGTIQFSSGTLQLEDDTIIGGEFVIDMTSINVTDLTGESKGKLEGHLKSDDFFGVNNFPTSKLLITSAEKTSEGHYVTADLTIKDITEPVNFVLNLNEDTATTSLKIDRTKYGVRYGSGSFFDNLGDNTISDNFELDVTLKF
ncbi:YceI family protein [Croceibacter atlanticus]|uniref:YceI family protein n=1 Tax=Croceibacter atlanticus TaxID=313588 RepID=UPI0030F72468